MIARILIFSSLWLAFCSVARSQNADDMHYVRQAFLPQEPVRFDHTSPKEDRHLGQKIAAAGFFFYKKCISSQDFRRCTFTMSCSEFCLRAVQKHGFVTGMVMGLDRYSRCHGMHRAYYAWDKGRKRSIDPVSR